MVIYITGAVIVITINSLNAVVAKVGQKGNAKVMFSIIAIRNMLNEKTIVLNASLKKTFGIFLCTKAVAPKAKKLPPRS